MTKRDLQRIETRNKLYETALDLFLSKGFDKVSVQEIVKAAGVSVGAFYHHFSSKEDIIDEGYRDFDTDLEEQFLRDKPKAGIETILYLNSKQNEFCIEHGLEWTSIFFKNQLGIEHEYMFNDDRFLVNKLYESVNLVNKGDNSNKEIVEDLLRMTRGAVYDWCLHGGVYDLNEKSHISTMMCLKYYNLI